MRHLSGVAAASAAAVVALGLINAGQLAGTGLAAQSPAAFVPVPCETRDWTAPETPFAPAPGTATRALSGKYSGGLYRIEIPEKWNGELVLWAHGSVPTTGEGGTVLRVSDPPLRPYFIDQGFAWAASSYHCNGYIAGQGFVDTVALLDEFTKLNGKAPARTYFFGASMGGYATLLAMHEMPAAFAGGLAVCPAGPDLLNFFDESATGAAKVAGIKSTPASLQDDLKTLATALGTPPDYTAAGREAANRQIAASGGPRPFAAEGLATGNQFFSNITLGAPALVGAALSPARPAYREQMPFSGRINAPLMTMHTTGDLFVPMFLERTLNKAVVAADRAQFLVQRIYRSAGHCTFSPAETRTAFEDLVMWVHAGAKPKGDDVMGDLTDAGRQFTNPLRPGDPGGLTVK